ncbi:MAG: hypothetical protein GEV10_11700 [Streptosporangiales bacterium]|nr:hypothetical protein [Streptosporangiales bacterium]
MAQESSIPSPHEWGVGCRFSLYPMCDDFTGVILGALREADGTGLEVETDDVSTYVGGDERAILRYVCDVVAAASRRTGHVVAHLLLSRGCPGEVTCELGDDDAPPPASALPALPPTGVRAAAHWSLYPLGVTGHMDTIAAAVTSADTLTGSVHYASRLDGDLAEVLTTIGAGWVEAGAHVRHVVTHATVSVGSPTVREVLA